MRNPFKPAARRDMGRVEMEAFGRLKAELTRAFGAPDEAYRPLDGVTVIGRNRGATRPPQ